MNSKMNMIYWKSENFWLGKLLEHPEIMTQGESLEELEANIKEAYLSMAMDNVPKQYETKEIVWLVPTLQRGNAVVAAPAASVSGGSCLSPIVQD